MAILAADLGGTRIKLGVVQDGRIHAQRTLDTERGGLLPQLPAIARHLREMTGSLVIDGVFFAFPSVMDTHGRVTSDIGKYPDAMDLDLKAWCLAEFGVPFTIENDARAAAVGEWQYGVGRGVLDLVMVTLGTGIGTGVIAEGRVLRGRHGQAGCMGGHLVLRYGGRPCLCGGIGCAEAEASSVSLSLLSAEADLREPLDYKGVFEAASAGDPAAITVRDHSLEVWSALSVSLIHAYDPEILVIGGGIARTGQWLADAIQTYTDRHTWTPWGKVPVVLSTLGDDAALLAGEWLARESRPA